jgi:hypothetical protein
MSAWRREIQALPPEWRGLALMCGTTTYNFGADVNSLQKIQFKRESIISGAGFVLIIVAVIIVFVIGQMNPQQLMSVCFLFALGAAGFLVFLPGFLQLSGIITPKAWLQKLEFKAGGAIAIFILVFLLLHHSLEGLSSH